MKRRNPIDFDDGVKSLGKLWPSVCKKNLVDMIQTAVFAQSLSNFTFKLLMMRGGIVLILGHRSKVKINFNPL